jgi:hypothetical protein
MKAIRWEDLAYSYLAQILLSSLLDFVFRKGEAPASASIDAYSLAL